MALILNIETATPVCSVALSRHGKLLALAETHTRLEHANKLTLFIENCLTQSGVSIKDIDAVAVSQGPGSYTGLRIGLSTAKGICYALNKPLILVDTLESLAMLTQQNSKITNAHFCPMIDARRMEVYCNVFDKKITPLEKTQALVVENTAFQTYFEQEQKVVFSGDGAEKCKSLLVNDYAIFYEQAASAEGMVSLSQIAYQKNDFQDIAYANPLYLKAPNITTPKKRL